MFDSWELLHFIYDGLIICNQKHSVKRFFSDNDMIIKKKSKHNQNQDLQDCRMGRIKGKGKRHPQMAQMKRQKTKGKDKKQPQMNTA